MDQTGAYTACEVLARYGYGAGLEAAVMTFTEARNDKPPLGGLTQAGGWLYSGIAKRGVVRIVAGERGCQHPPPSSGTLVGETTRRVTLNLHRGSQPVGARRIVGKRKWQPEQSGEK